MDAPTRSRGDDTAHAAWRRRDLFRSCKTGEVIEAQPLADRLRSFGVAVLVAVPLVPASNWFFRTWIPRHYAELDLLAKTDLVSSARKLAEFTSLLLLAPVLTCAIAVMGAMVQVSRVLRAGRWPLRGAKTMRRTEVVGGLCARILAVLVGLLLLACLLVSWSAYVALETMFWNGYFDKRIEVSSKTSLRMAAPKSAHAPGLNAIGVNP